MANLKQRKIGILGGTFDPIHEGHLAIAEQAKEMFNLAEVLFIPAADPPHKKRPCTSYLHRVAMLELALDNTTFPFSISLLESERTTPSYSVETMTELIQRLGKQDYFFIMGADSILELHLWYRFKEFLQLTKVLVADRPGVLRKQVEKVIRELPGEFFFLEQGGGAFSSSEIRLSLSQGREPAGVPAAVLGYIHRYDLYHSSSKSFSKSS